MPVKKILFVDDDLEHTFGFKQRLEMEGFEVKRAMNANQAWETLIKEKFDGIIIDIMLPSNNLFSYEDTDQDLKTGILLCQKIRREYVEPIKIVGLTHHQSTKIKNEFMDAGGDDYVEKNTQGAAEKLSQTFTFLLCN
ncbi:MAG: response regulator transcription factor [Calditrichaceae bacterium]|nr:response regulator transcription factor [Calditrichaceae bacterium]